ncbi:MAG: RICIN domain-containing protein [Lachnospiraceae bacterium]|nr:RICIN domain-containing protein [Lachnospiraceae bacterium]
MNMKQKVLAIAMCISVVFGCLQIDSITAKAAPAAYSEKHYENGFDSDNVNEMDKADWENKDMFHCKWEPENIIFYNGIMDMRIDRADGHYTGGEYRTKEYFGYGFYQVRMKPIKNDGVVSSFFTYTGPSDGTTWDEIDIEFLGKDTTHVQFNYYVDGRGGHEKWYDLGFDASEEYHTYGFNWYEGGITWYVDGEPVYTAPSIDIFPSHPGKIMMNVWPGIGVDDWLNAYDGRTPLHAYYDWISWDAPDNNDTSSALFDKTKTYKLINYNSGHSVDVSYGNAENGTNILQYGYNGYNNQKWFIELQSNGYYIIKNMATGKVLTVEDFATWDGANVYQWEYVGNANQEWDIVPARDNTYKIINRHSGLLLNVAWESTDANANIEQYHDEDGSAQLWWIDLTD